MKYDFDTFECMADAVHKVDELVELATKEKHRVDKKERLKEAQDLADQIQKHCEAGGNHQKQFVTIYKD